MRYPAILTLAAILLSCLPAVSAHGAPDPSEEFTRLLADWNDDCGGDGGAATGACKGSQDLIALDVQEASDATLGDVTVFRLYADAGRTYPITDTLSLSLGGASKTFSVSTQDGNSYSNSGFDRIGSPQSLHDGGRFYIDLTVKDSTLGQSKGGHITGFKVESKAGSAVGDFMPGGCHNMVGDCVDTGQSADQYIAGGGSGSYTLRGSGYYATLTGPSETQAVAVGSDRLVQLDLKNNFRSMSQTITVSASDGNGVSASFHAGDSGKDSTGDYKQTLEVAIPGGGSTSLHLRLVGNQPASGTVHITYTTDRGGAGSLDVPYEVSASGGTTTSPPTAPPTSSHKSPFPTVPLVLLGLLALAGRRR